ncbi:MAG: 2OG-Fe(II) oxygenase [Ketobacteraceae bacterium]|nr:2OG-Fe(II) oxygenase [Ketobacteraceae bacterium]
MTQMLDLKAIEDASVSTDPYPYFVVDQSISSEEVSAVLRDFPVIDKGGSFPLDQLECGPHMDALVKELDSEAFRGLIEKKLDIDLSGRPMTVTARGYSRAKDGRIHTDSKSKLITVLIYLNESWESSEGRLRVLKNGEDMDDYVSEIPPTAGKLFAFKVTPNCWHGYPPYEGRRQSIQVNFVADEKAFNKHQSRHGLTAKLKSLLGGK